MSSEFYTFARRSNMLPYTNIPHLPSRSPFAGISPDPATHLLQRRPDLISGKRSLAEFQQQQQLNHLRRPQSLSPYLRNVKQRMYHEASSPLSPEVSSMNPRYGLPILLQQPRALPTINSNTFNGSMNQFGINLGVPTSPFSASPQGVEAKMMNRIQELEKELLDDNESDAAINLCVPTSSSSLPPQGLETNMMNKLQELEKELLDDEDDNDEGDEEVSGVINSEWSETFQNCLVDQTNKNHEPQIISPSPTSSSSSSSSTSASPIACPKQLLIDATSAISEGKSDAALELLTRLSQLANVKGTPEQRLVSYMVSALRSRVNPTEFPAPVSQLYTQDHTIATHNLYDISASFKLGFMAANLAILEATTMGDQFFDRLHVVDFDVGQGRQYLHLLHALARQKDRKCSILKITVVTDYYSRGEDARLKGVADALKALGNKIGISLIFNVMSLKISELSREKLGLMEDEALAVNLAFKLHKLPDESVTTENLRDELLRRVKRLSPQVVTVVEQEMHCNTATFGARVNEVFGYYSALFESLEAVVSRESPERIRLEEGLGRKIANSVACEGSDRVERFEVFGKWRARMGMAGFRAKPMSQLVADSLRSKLSTVTRGNIGFTVNEQSGGICFGWMGRSLTVASAWH